MSFTIGKGIAMKTEIQKAVDLLTASYGDINREVKGYHFIRDDIEAALKEEQPGTAKHLVLTLLLAQSVMVKSKQKKTLVINDVVTPKSVIDESDNADSPTE